MSVLLTACRNSKQKCIERALKERAKKQKERRDQQQTRYNDSFDSVNPMSNPGELPGFRGYVQQSRAGEYDEGEAEGEAESEAEEIEPDTKIWTFLLDEEPFSIVFYKDTLDVYCNGEETHAMNNYPGDDTSDVTVDFCIGAHKARICLQSDGCSNGTKQLLTIDGMEVPA